MLDAFDMGLQSRESCDPQQRAWEIEKRIELLYLPNYYSALAPGISPLQRWFKTTSKVIPKWFRGTSKVLQRCFRGASEVLQSASK